MNTKVARQFSSSIQIRFFVILFLLTVFLDGAAVRTAFSQQNSFVCEKCSQTAVNFTGASTARTETGEMFRYVAIRGSDDVNVQFYLTTALALAAGFDEATANSIGLYNQYIDDNPKTSPVKPFNFKARRDYHFTSEKRRAQMWQAFLSEPNAANLGAFMHAKQDSYFHAGYNYIIGHIYKGVHPDQSWRAENYAKAQNAARATFEAMLKAVPVLGTSNNALVYADIEPQVIEFLRAADDSSRGNKFALLVERITALRGGKDADSQAALVQIFRGIKNYSFDPKNWQDDLSELALKEKK